MEMNILFHAIVLSLYLELQFVLNFIAELFKLINCSLKDEP